MRLAALGRHGLLNSQRISRRTLVVHLESPISLQRQIIGRKSSRKPSYKRIGLIGLAICSLPLLSSTVSYQEEPPSDRPPPSKQRPALEAEQAYEDAPPTLPKRAWLWLLDYVFEPIATGRRFVYLVILFMPVILAAPVLLLELLQTYEKHRGIHIDRELASTRWWYRMLVKQMERAGPTFIKLAQWAGSRRDLFPEELCDLFGRLHSGGRPHSLRYTKKSLERSFRIPFDEIFSEFEEKPMGIGAVAQAYKGTLKPEVMPHHYTKPKHVQDPSPTARVTRAVLPSPEDAAPSSAPPTAVAIKVLHPNVNKTIRRDLRIMSFFAKMINALPGMHWLSLPDEVKVFGEMMQTQLDLRVEAANLERFEVNFRHRRTVNFPRALVDYTSKDVLVEEYEDAVPLKAFLREGGGPFDARIANLGLEAFLNMLLIDNFTHADLHPGNIMVKFYRPTSRSFYASFFANLRDTYEPDPAATDESTKIAHELRSISHDREPWLKRLRELDDDGWQPEIVFIDTGLVTELHGNNRQNFLDLFTAVAEFDGLRAGRLMVERCRTPDLVIDGEGFAEHMRDLVKSVKKQTFSLAQIRISDILSDVLMSVRRHHVRLEGDFINTVLSILLLEGIGRQLSPELDLFKSALPILRQLGMQLNKETMMESIKSGTTGGLSGSSIFPLLKLWVWMEARSLASIPSSDTDAFVRYDVFAPNV